MAFEMLSLWRLRHQAIQLASGQPADNHVHPAELTEIEQAALRKIFEQIHLFQSRIRLDFTGSL
jgi:signal-transduction protein with cAMP-binding, CBS, and nucleotidyltransferase domain